MNKSVIVPFAFSLIILLTFASCTKNWKTYVVKAGNHSASELSKPIFNVDKIDFNFRVNSSWYYKEPENPGWNKIRGISHGHHQNNSSARLGYQCLHDSILVVGAYCYVDGVSPQENPNQKGIIDTIQSGKVYRCSISRENGRYYFKFENKNWAGPAGENLNWGYELNPYIGGEFTLDHDWFIEIKDRK